MELCIGLFGTCGGSKWRDGFIAEYTRLGIDYFNPQVDDWKPELADIEAHHLANDAIILFPITAETYGLGSLAETGFSILQAMRLDDRRDFVVKIDRFLLDHLDNAELVKESLRARALVYQHLLKLRLPNVYLVDTFAEMLHASVELYQAAAFRVPLMRFNPQNR